MHAGEIKLRTQRYDARWVDFLVGHVVVPFDVIHVHGRGDTRLLIQIAKVTLKVGIIDDPAEVALEMAVVYLL